ncbi:hypothetical protein [Streptomyces sp. NPDC005322]|uniref:hypothetical protein n=1 Tax=unclassified Streptomyces TaxID=2593676 RepID=UPI0033BA340C
MDRHEQPTLTPDLPPVVDVPDLTFPARGRHSEGSKSTAERAGDKESPTSSSGSRDRRMTA